MKTIGRSNNQGWIVEFTEREYEAFLEAQQAAKGLSLTEVLFQLHEPREINVDMAQFFQALKLFCLGKFKVDELRDLVEALELTLRIVKPEENPLPEFKE